MRPHAGAPRAAPTPAAPAAPTPARAAIEYALRLLRSYGVDGLSAEAVRLAKFDAPQARRPLLAALHDLALCVAAGLPRGGGEGVRRLRAELLREAFAGADSHPPAEGELLLLHLLAGWGCPGGLVAALALPAASAPGGGSRACLLALAWLIGHARLFDAALQHLQLPPSLLPLLPPYPDDTGGAAEPQARRADAARAAEAHARRVLRLLAAPAGAGAGAGAWAQVQAAAQHVLASYRGASLRLQLLTSLQEGREKLLDQVHALQAERAPPAGGGPPLSAFELHLLGSPPLLEAHAQALQQACGLLEAQLQCAAAARTFFAWAGSVLEEERRSAAAAAAAQGAQALPPPAVADVAPLLRQLPPAGSPLAGAVMRRVARQLHAALAGAGAGLGAGAQAGADDALAAAPPGFVRAAAAAMVASGLAPGPQPELAALPDDVTQQLRGAARRGVELGTARQRAQAAAAQAARWQRRRVGAEELPALLGELALADAAGGPAPGAAAAPPARSVPVAGELQRLSAAALAVAKGLARARGANKQRMAAASELLLAAGGRGGAPGAPGGGGALRQRRTPAAAGAMGGAGRRPAALLLLLALALGGGGGPGAGAGAGVRVAAAAAAPLRFAIVNQVHFHLEVVAGAMQVLSGLTSAPVTVYLPAKVLSGNWYGFRNWLGAREGFEWKECKDYDGTTTYDLVWFVSPEYHISWVASVAAQMKPAVALVMVHNGHIPDADFNKIKAINPGFPLITLSPHVAANISSRAAPVSPQWLLPIYPYTPGNACALADIQGGKSCLKGFSVQGRIEKSRRNYTEMWEQISAYRTTEGADALKNFRLNILGESVEFFSVPAPVRDLVAVYKNPPYPIFYDVVYHSYGLVPMLASPLYYASKFSSTVLTSFITGVPIIADKRFMAAYSMIERPAVYYQDDDKNELDVMFSVARMAPEEMWRTRLSLDELRRKMNTRVAGLLVGWLKDKGLAPDVPLPGADAAGTAGGGGVAAAAGAGRRRDARRALLSPLWLLERAAEQAAGGVAALLHPGGAALPAAAHPQPMARCAALALLLALAGALGPAGAAGYSVLFYPLSERTHMLVHLKLATELAARGHTVHFMTADCHQDFAEATATRFAAARAVVTGSDGSGGSGGAGAAGTSAAPRWRWGWGSNGATAAAAGAGASAPPRRGHGLTWVPYAMDCARHEAEKAASQAVHPLRATPAILGNVLGRADAVLANATLLAQLAGLAPGLDLMVNDVLSLGMLLSAKLGLPHVDLDVGTAGALWEAVFYGAEPAASYAPGVGTFFATNGMPLWQRAANLVATKLARGLVAAAYWAPGGPVQRLVSRHAVPLSWPYTSYLLLLTNSNFATEPPRALPPSARYVGPILPEPARPLPARLADWLAGAGPGGAVLVSFGGTLQAPLSASRTLAAAMAAMPGVRFVWRLSGEHQAALAPELAALPNVLVDAWLPQNDLLGAPGLRAFVSQGGYLSMAEAAYHGVPVLGMPFIVGQGELIRFAEDQGRARRLPADTLTAGRVAPFVAALTDLLQRPSYAAAAAVTAARLRAARRPYVAEAADAVEFAAAVAEHGPFLQPFKVRQWWHQQVMLDVILLYAAAAALPAWLTLRALRRAAWARAGAAPPRRGPLAHVSLPAAKAKAT
ncbi:Ugt3a1 [Scenedesmus sp. PABB004]|nr:Ugt3a1 [Scenedesmus sp. PABB004]